jgi:hypothetical protein
MTDRTAVSWLLIQPSCIITLLESLLLPPISGR